MIMSCRTLHPGMAHNGIWIKSGKYDAPSCLVDNYPDNKLNVVANHENSINMTMMVRGNMEGRILSSKGDRVSQRAVVGIADRYFANEFAVTTNRVRKHA